MNAPLFLNPSFLSALGLGALPILIHLIRRRRVKIVPWAAWDFLLQSRRKNRRKLRIEQLLLLALRVLIVCLAVLAFCRPLLRSVGLPLLAADARVHALIVLDNSYSMGYVHDGKTDFQRAQETADMLLTRVLKQGDSVSIVLLSSKPDALLREPSYNLETARERIRTARLSDAATDYGATAVLSASLMRDSTARTKEVYWITDSQKSGFQEANQERDTAAWRDLTAQTRLTWINVAGSDRENLSLEAPTFSREMVTPQSPVRLETVVHNNSRTARNGLMLNLTVDGKTEGSTRVDVPAGGTARAAFVYLFARPGIHTGSIALAQPDALPRDNAVPFAVKVRETLKVLIVDPKPGASNAQDEAFYLTTALAPVGATEGGSTAIQPTVQTGSKLTGTNLRAYDAVVITGMSEFTAEDRRVLEDFVRNGGGALLFPSPTTDVAKVNAALGGDALLLPATLGAKHVVPDENALSLNPATISHPALASFRDTNEINIGSAHFTTTYDLTLPDGDDTVRVMCRYSGGQPAFVERRFGQGKLILAASTAGISGNNMPYKPAYVPMVHQLVAYLAAGPTAQRNLRLGDALTARFDVKESGKPIRLTLPDGQTILQKTVLGADGVTLTYPETTQAGLYRLGFSGNEVADAFAVQLPSNEANLLSLDDAQVQAAVGAGKLQFARGGQDIVSTIQRTRRGTEIWRTLVLLVVPLLFLESFLAMRFGRRG